MDTPSTNHYCDVLMGIVASQITSLTIVYTTVYSDADQSKHQSCASLAFMWGIPGTGEFPAQMASYAENVSIWWHHHDLQSHENSFGEFAKWSETPVTGEFPTQKASDAENASIWWRHHVRRVNGCLFSAMKGFNHLLVFENYVKCKSMLLFYSLNKLSFTRDPMSC